MIGTFAILAVVVIAAMAVVLAIASTRPGNFRIQRSTSIAAPADRIYPLISNLRSMNTWNPFADPDPAMKVVYSGPESGKGAAHEWAGNRQVGEGRIEIKDAVEPSKLTMSLDMTKPFTAHNTVEFTLAPHGSSTMVTWAMSGPQPLLAKAMSMFVNCDKMVGTQFEKGLTRLKALAEA